MVRVFERRLEMIFREERLGQRVGEERVESFVYKLKRVGERELCVCVLKSWGQRELCVRVEESGGQRQLCVCVLKRVGDRESFVCAC